MTSFLQLVSSLREQMSATLSRSDVLRPLAWLIAILVAGTVVTAVAPGAPVDLSTWFFFLLAGSVVLYGLGYLYCLFMDRDALRSENYSLHKMAIEQHMLGDSVSGLFEADKVSPSSSEAAAIKQIEGGT